MMIAEDGGQTVSGAAQSYLQDRYYWVSADGRKQIAQVVRSKGQMKWKLAGCEPRAFVDVVYQGPIQEPE